MIIPYHVDVAMDRVPFMNWILITLTCIVTFVAWGIDSKQTEIEIDPSIFQSTDWENPQSVKEFQKKLLESQPRFLSLQRNHFALYQLISHLFVHNDIWHLAGNMLILFIFGNAINGKLGHWSFLGLYLMFGILAGLCWLLLDRGFAALGASGAIMGICGIYLVLYPKNEVSILWWFFIRGGIIEIASYWLLLFWFVGDLIGCFMSGGGIAYVAHLGGAIAGFAVGLFLVVNDWVESPAGEENLLQVWGFRESSERWDWKGERRVTKKKPRSLG
ncbi:MAG TPA: rhomboid family intramembrane serine protease [Gemmataceae bacterium]|jgi:membrane associated rhomboid family serine protease|nr:rhomboid family intramembrane serine protease [Gemmataceae bacterium]